MNTSRHRQCERCWIAGHAVLNTDDPPRVIGVDELPIRITDEDGWIAPPDICCFCGEVTISGICVRADPRSLPHCPENDPARRRAAGLR